MIDNFLKWISRACWRVNYQYQLREKNDYSLVYAQTPEELIQLVEWAVSDNLLERQHISKTDPILYKLSRNGWKRIYEIEKNKQNINQAFVATWFDDSIDPIYHNGIKPALGEAGYTTIWMKTLLHNGKIDDRIIAEIRRSGLLVADFTGNRGGVYYEAGFALGLGIPVIWACKNDENEISNLHFDTRQYSHILWDDAADLKTKLFNHIMATIPGRINVQNTDS